MKEELFIVSDIHGCYDQLMQLLKNWEYGKQELVLNGDLVDRGAQSKETLLFANQIMLNGDGIVTMGNHDNMLLDFLTQPESELSDMYMLWYYQGGRETSYSLLDMPASEIDRLTPKELRVALGGIPYIRDTLELFVNYYEYGKVLCVHGGIPPYRQKDWKATPKMDMIWERSFYRYPNETGKVIISGHTPTRSVWGDPDNDNVWSNKQQDILLIDGACAYGGQLNGIVVDRNGKVLQTYVAK